MFEVRLYSTRKLQVCPRVGEQIQGEIPEKESSRTILCHEGGCTISTAGVRKEEYLEAATYGELDHGI